MARNTFSILGEQFKTKGALADRIRQIRDSYPDNCPLSLNHKAFMSDVLKGHPQYDQKTGCGVKDIFVMTNPVYRNTRCFYLTRTDNTSTDFSFLECLTPTAKEKKFMMALRAAVEPITIEFKNNYFDNPLNAPYRCPYTGEKLAFVGSHVDHKSPNTFKELASRFIREYKIDIRDIELSGSYEDNTYQDRLVDKCLEQTWVDFHNRYADLQVVSRTANLSILRS